MLNNQKYLYHGSNKLIENTLMPFPSKVVDGNEKVFATPSKAFALMFMGKRWHDNDIEFGGHGNKYLYAIEKKKDIFNKIFHNKTGYLYKVSSKQFHSDKRLGMKRYEFIADEPVRIISTQKINDILKELLKSDIFMIKYDKIKFIYFNQNKYNSDIINIDKFNYTKLENIVNNIKNYTKKNIIVNGTINYKDIWKKLYNLDRNDIITKIGLVEIKKNEYTYVVY